MPDFKNYTILVVDDDPDIRELISAIFLRVGYKTLTADCGLNALEIVNSTSIDVVVTDIRMPNGDGLFLLEKIRTRDPKVPIVFIVTGYSDISESEFISKGATKVFLKPFSQILLVDEVNCSLGLQSAT